MERVISMFDKKLYWYRFNKIVWKTLIIMFLIMTCIFSIHKFFFKIIYRIFGSFLNFLWIKILLFRDYIENQTFKWYKSCNLEDYIIFPVRITQALDVPFKKPEPFNFKNQYDSYMNYIKILITNIKNFKSNCEFKILIHQLILLLYYIISRPIIILTDIIGLRYFFHILWRAITILFNEWLSYNWEKYNKPYFLKFTYNPKMRNVILRVQAIKYFGKRTWGQTITYYLVIFLKKILELRIRYTEYALWYFSPLIAERFETLSFLIINRYYLKFHFIRFINFIIFKKWRILYNYIIVDFLFFVIKLIFQLIKFFLLIFFPFTNVKLNSYFEKINFYLEYFNNKISLFLNRILQMLSTIYSILFYWVIVDLLWFKILGTLYEVISCWCYYIFDIRHYISNIIKSCIEKPEKLQFKVLKKLIISYIEQGKLTIFWSMNYFWVLILCIKFRNFIYKNILQKLILDNLLKLFTMLWEVDPIVNVDLRHDEIDYEWLIWEDYDNADIDWETEHYCIDMKEFEHPEIQQPIQIMPSIIYTKFLDSQKSYDINGPFERIVKIYYVFKWLKKIKFVLNFVDQASVFKWARKFQFIWKFKFKWEKKFQFTWKFKDQEIMHRSPVLRDDMSEIKKELYKKNIFFTNNNKTRDMLIPRMRCVWQYYNKNKKKYAVELKKFIWYIMQNKNKEYNLRKFYYILDRKRVKMKTPCRYSLMRSYLKDQIMFKKFNFVIVRLLNEYFSSLKKRNWIWWWYLIYELDYTKYILQRKKNYSQIIKKHIRYDAIDYYKKSPLPENIYNTRFLTLRQTFTRLCQIEKFYWKNANVKIIEFAWHFLFLEIRMANEPFYCKNTGNNIYKIRRYGRYRTNLYNTIKRRSNISGAVWYRSRQRYVEWAESRNLIWYKSKKLDFDSLLTIAKWPFYNHLYSIKPAKFFYKYMTENIVLKGYPLFNWFAWPERRWWWSYSPDRIMATIGRYNWELFRYGLKFDYYSWYMYNVQNIRTNVKPVINSWFEEELESWGGSDVMFPKKIKLKRDYQTWYMNNVRNNWINAKSFTDDLFEEIPISLEQQNRENIMSSEKVWQKVPGFNTKWDENIDAPGLNSTIQYNNFLYKQKYLKRSIKNSGVLHITDELTFQKKFQGYIRRTGSEKKKKFNKCYKYQTTLLELDKLLKIGKYRFNIHMNKFLFIHSIVVCNIIKNINPITIISKFFDKWDFRLTSNIEIYRKILVKIINTIENNREQNFLIDILYSSNIKDVKIVFDKVIDYLKFWKSLIFNIESWSNSKIANIGWDLKLYERVMLEMIIMVGDPSKSMILIDKLYFRNFERYRLNIENIKDYLRFWKGPIINDREWLHYDNKEIKNIWEISELVEGWYPFTDGVEKYWNPIKFWWKFYCECYLKMIENKYDEIANSWLIFILALNAIKKLDDFCNHIQWWCSIFKKLNKIYGIDENYFDEKKLRWAFFWLINELDQHIILLDYWRESDDWIYSIFEECDTIVWYSKNKLNEHYINIK